MKLLNLKDGLKRARKNHVYINEEGKQEKFTQKILSETIHVSLDTVRNWEQGKAIPSLSMLLVLSDLYQCDLDYLTGKIECKTHDLQFICSQTGLTEQAAVLLQTWGNEGYNGITDLSAVLSDIITSNEFPKMINYAMKLRNARNPKIEQIEKQKTYASLSGIQEPDTAVSQSFKDQADVAWMRATQTFQNILDDISE